MASPEDMIALQRNLRLNQTELSDYLSDLQSWESEIKKKDDVIKHIDEPTAKSSEALRPPPRNIVKPEKKAPKIVPKSTAENSEKKEKIRSYDYRAWDKFDVDGACEQIEREEAPKVQNEESDPEEEANIELGRRKQRALFYKEQGNKCFKSGKNKDALLYYTKGIESDPANALLYANRAMANLKSENFQEVIEDCTKSIQLDPTYPKSYQRRGVALTKLDRIQEAEDDFKQVLKLLPDNKEAIAELKKISLIKENKSGIANANNVVLPVKKPVSKRSKVPLRRITVEDVRNEVSLNISAVSEEAKFIRKKTDKGETGRSNGFVTELPVSNDSLDASGDTMSAANREDDLPRRLSPRIDPTPLAAVTSVPEPAKTPVQFMVDFRRLQSAPEFLYRYLQQIDPEDLQKLIPASSLDAKLLKSFLETIRDFYLPNKHPVFQTLNSLSRIRRFSMITMFLSKPEKELVSMLLEHVKTTEQCSETELKSLYKAFSL